MFCRSLFDYESICIQFHAKQNKNKNKKTTPKEPIFLQKEKKKKSHYWFQRDLLNGASSVQVSFFWAHP